MKLFYTLGGIVADKWSFSSSKSTEIDLEGSSDVCLTSYFSVAYEKSCFLISGNYFHCAPLRSVACFFHQPVRPHSSARRHPRLDALLKGLLSSGTGRVLRSILWANRGPNWTSTFIYFLFSFSHSLGHQDDQANTLKNSWFAAIAHKYWVSQKMDFQNAAGATVHPLNHQ